MQTPLQFDAFFDGAEGTQTAAQTQQLLPGYRPLHTEVTSTGQPITAVMRPGRSGIQGTIIPKAGMDGAPEGFNPHDMSQMIVHYDPHIRGQGCSVRLGDITPEHVTAASRAIQGALPAPTSLQTRRLFGAAAMHVVASQVANGHAPSNDFGPVSVPQQEKWANHQASPVAYQQVPQGYPQPQQPSTMPVITQPLPPSQPQQPRRVQSLGAFGQVQQQPQPQQQAPPPVFGFATPAPQQVEHPHIKVYIERQYQGVSEAYFHDVYVDPENQFIALMYATDYRGYKYFPTKGEMAGGMMMMAVSGTSDLYTIEPLDIRFPHNGFDYGLIKVVEHIEAQQVFP